MPTKAIFTHQIPLIAIVHFILLFFIPLSDVKAQDQTVIRNVTVIKGDGTQPQRNKDVLIKDGRIVKITHAATDDTPYQGMKILNATGQYLSPGFIDTHAHLAMGPVSVSVIDGGPILAMQPSENLPRVTLERLLAHGVTTSRDPGGHTETTIRAKSQQATGAITGASPHVAGLIFDITRFDNLVETVETADDLRNRIDRQAEAGVDWIKLYTGLPSDLVKAGINHAHKRGLKVTGHLDTTTWTEAARAGIDSIVHIVPGSAALLPENTRDSYAASRLITRAFFSWFEHVDFQSPAFQEMITALRENNVSIDPTLVLFHSIAFGNTDTYKAQPGLDDLPAELTENWRTSFHMNIGWTDADYVYAQAQWGRVLDFTKLLFDEGIMLTTGTDANNPFILPGESFHQELALLVSAGISPLEVHQMATLNGAKLLGQADDIGTVEEGKIADLVLLGSNPVTSISATKEIVWVMQRGTLVHDTR
ncbi:amidohydrolase [Kordiimonas sediminis]|uniref:Amidohydrolase n=1 Tax=Kordiimonas sediminis TaxID=1735581 RepID=A0A919AK29_9PROT|nr:amidohydrolase family protein [Kordiimonas sediminis]GHF13442.1 amidohydrolase [Kordiimonas sediminis]